jgi:hypothetical protein
MNKLGKFVLFCNFALIGFMVFLFISLLIEGGMDFIYFLVLTGICLFAVLNIYYMLSHDDTEDSLYTLWVKTKKKKLKDELGK